MRKDQVFSLIFYESGMILYPNLKIPNGKNKYDVVCAFPADGNTDDRSGHHRCEKFHTDSKGESNHTQKITSLEKWIERFKKIVVIEKGDLFNRQCGFDMTSKDFSAAEQFDLVIKTKKYLHEYSPDYAWRANEVRVQIWDENHPEYLPIEAFFYMIDKLDKEMKH